MDGNSFFGLNLRDIALGIIGLLVSIMTWVFRNHDARLVGLEVSKIDKDSHDRMFAEVISRMDRQDRLADDRTTKIDRIIELMIINSRDNSRVRDSWKSE